MGPSFDICIIEMWAVLLELRLINRAPLELLHRHDMLYLFVDNKPVVLWIAGKQKMQHLYVRDVLLLVYAEMKHLFDRAAIRCTIQWTRRGKYGPVITAQMSRQRLQLCCARGTCSASRTRRRRAARDARCRCRSRSSRSRSKRRMPLMMMARRRCRDLRRLPSRRRSSLSLSRWMRRRGPSTSTASTSTGTRPTLATRRWATAASGTTATATTRTRTATAPGT